jgi:hypothetical protein
MELRRKYDEVLQLDDCLVQMNPLCRWIFKPTIKVIALSV